MTRRLYLDTARLGLMSSSARRIHIDFARFAGEEAASVYFDDFLRHGADAWPDSLWRRYRALGTWRGIPHLKASLKRLAGASQDSSVLIAARSAQLMKMAADFLVRECRNVLVADVCWPSYLRILRKRMQSTPARLTHVPIRRKVFRNRIKASELVTFLADSFADHGCDGLFLPAVDNLGVQLPIAEIVHAIKARAEVRFIVVDGAQALSHVPVELRQGDCDIFLAGSHKWLHAYHPLGLAFFGHPQSATYIDHLQRAMLASRTLDDPLLRYIAQLETQANDRYGETVNVLPLFTCQGAVDDALLNCASDRRKLNESQTLFELAERVGWKPIVTDHSLCSRIKLLKAPPTLRSSWSPAQLRRQFHEAGVAVTVYNAGLVRVSLPDKPWTQYESTFLSAALSACNSRGLHAGRYLEA